MARFIIAAIFIVAGLLVFAIATFGVFRFRYVLNRMHIAAQSDTMGLLLSLIGVMILTGFTFTTLKILLIIAFFWAASPLSAHLIARSELSAHAEEDMEQFEVEDLDK